jgi:hypothetical protein
MNSSNVSAAIAVIAAHSQNMGESSTQLQRQKQRRAKKIRFGRNRPPQENPVSPDRKLAFTFQPSTEFEQPAGPTDSFEPPELTGRLSSIEKTRDNWSQNRGASLFYELESEVVKVRNFKPQVLKPWLPRSHVRLGKGTKRERGVMERLHIILTVPEASKSGTMFSIAILFVILLSCIGFMVDTVPSTAVYSARCNVCKPLSSSQSGDEASVEWRAEQTCEGCQPGPNLASKTIETFTIAIFTAEYLLKLFTAYAVPLQSETQPPEKPLWLIEPESQPFGVTKERYLLRTWEFIKHPLSIIDVIAIVSCAVNPMHFQDMQKKRKRKKPLFSPFYFICIKNQVPYYVELITAQTISSLAVVRIIRLFRIFRVFRFGRLSDGARLFARVIQKSMFVFLLFIVSSRKSLSLLPISPSLTLG